MKEREPSNIEKLIPSAISFTTALFALLMFLGENPEKEAGLLPRVPKNSDPQSIEMMIRNSRIKQTGDLLRQIRKQATQVFGVNNPVLGLDFTVDDRFGNPIEFIYKSQPIIWNSIDDYGSRHRRWIPDDTCSVSYTEKDGSKTYLSDRGCNGASDDYEQQDLYGGLVREVSGVIKNRYTAK